jgi:quinoprotein glucose dehydrogenase
MKYSPINDINRENVARLRPASIFHTGDISHGTRWVTRSTFESTPLVVDGVMYRTTPFSRLIALDRDTGAGALEFRSGARFRGSGKTLPQPRCETLLERQDDRIFLGTLSGRLLSSIAETGRPGDSFGVGGRVDLTHDFFANPDEVRIEIFEELAARETGDESQKEKDHEVL